MFDKREIVFIAIHNVNATFAYYFQRKIALIMHFNKAGDRVDNTPIEPFLPDGFLGSIPRCASLSAHDAIKGIVPLAIVSLVPFFERHHDSLAKGGTRWYSVT
jgi:hypothetical protein